MWDVDLKPECSKGNHIWSSRKGDRMFCKTCGSDTGLAFESWHLRARDIAKKICAKVVDNRLARIAYKEVITDDDLIYMKANYANKDFPILRTK